MEFLFLFLFKFGAVLDAVAAVVAPTHSGGVRSVAHVQYARRRVTMPRPSL